MSFAAKTADLLRPKATSLRVGPIGIDIALEAIHCVQLERSASGKPAVIARASLPITGSRKDMLENPLEVRSIIKRALASDKFIGRNAVIAMPSGMFRTMSINYRSLPGKEHEDAAIVGVMKDRLDGDLNNYVIDYTPVRNRSKNDERLALVAVSEREPVIGFLENMRKAGLDVQALEIGPVSISRLVSALSLESGADNVLVVNSGRRASFLTLISENDLLFDQEVAFGENSLVSQAAHTLDMPEELVRDLILRAGVSSAHDNVNATLDEAGLVSTISEILKPLFLKLVEEIKRVCMYAAAETRGGSVSNIYLLGSIARWPGSAALLTSLTDMEVSTIPDPLSVFPSEQKSKSPTNEQTAPEMVIATGAALRGFRDDG